MKGKSIITGLVCILFAHTLHAQLSREEFAANGEVVLASAKNDIQDTEALWRIASPDHRHSHDSVYYYVMLPEMEAFNALGIPFSRKPHPNKDFKPQMMDVAAWNQSKSTDCFNNLTAYPTYGLYEQIMAEFATDFPEICRLHILGILPSGRKILAVRITANPDSIEAEPRFLYTSTMHGDETAGYILCIRLIREMLCGYGTDGRITNLINNADIWINPLANPDGTYHGGNHTVANARRGNAANVDLNRNFPDPAWGPNPYGVAHQPETVIFMNFAEAWPTNLSSNLHGGIEVINYPWDYTAQLHPDNAWWVHVCREYADTAQANSPSGYFNDLNNGITNGYQWYPVHGGRQDFVTYFRRGRETTLELTSTKLMPTSQFESRWQYNRASLYNYMEQCLYGLRGVVTDAQTGEPLEALITVEGYDQASSQIYSQLPHGNYHRYLKDGFYLVTYSAEGYDSQTFPVTVSDYNTIWLDVALNPVNTCNVVAGTITAITPLNGICTGDGQDNIVQVAVSGNQGLGRFGLLTQNNDVVAVSQSGSFNMENYPAGTYRIGHISYDETVNLQGITNASQLSGCYAASNVLQFQTTGISGGTVSISGSTTVCRNDGLPSVPELAVTGAIGPNKRWVLLNQNFSQVIEISQVPEFDFDNYPAGTYRIVHIAYLSSVSLQSVVLPDVPPCLAKSNHITIQSVNCAGISEYGASASSGMMQLSPNPADGILRIDLNSPEGEVTIEIFDVTGRRAGLIFHGQIPADEPAPFRYDVSLLTPGVYFCRVSGSVQAVERFIVK